jgi:LysM repeat protein
LAQRWGTTVAAIQNANPGVVATNLQIGQVINKPGGELSCDVYICIFWAASIVISTNAASLAAGNINKTRPLKSCQQLA